MGSYVPNTSEEQQEMLREIGFDSFEALFSHIPREVRVKGGLKLPEGLGEMEVIGKMKEIAKQNVVFKHIFRGAGAYSHYIPAIVKSVVSKEEFLTSYTPYQAEISQGILQSIFEYQTMLCQLTGMDVSNASVYDGATAAAEAAAMCRDRKRSRVYLSATTHPLVTEVVKTYCFGSGAQVVMVPEKNGVTDADALRELMDGTAACFYVQQPNYYGNLEDCSLLGAYVLTLQAREQHIRREKASSNVCSNQALCALTASVYMAAMGADGLRKTAVLCTSKAHYLKEQLEQAGLTARYDREFFHEFVTESDTDSGLILKALEEKGILGGLPLSHREILWCATEQNRKEDMDQAVQIVKEVCGA